MNILFRFVGFTCLVFPLGCTTIETGSAGASSKSAQRFAGRWEGPVQWAVVVGVTPIRLVIDDEVETVRNPDTGEVGVVRVSGNSLTWGGWGPGTKTQTWKLTPDPSGDSARVVVSDLLNSGSGTLKRKTRPAPPPAPKPKPSPRPQPSQSWR